jgi:hypothetical protein
VTELLKGLIVKIFKPKGGSDQSGGRKMESMGGALGLTTPHPRSTEGRKRPKL